MLRHVPVFKKSLSHVMILHVVDGHGLEPPPAEREDEGVLRLQHWPREPAMPLDAQLQSSPLLLAGQETADNNRIFHLQIVEEFGGK